MTVENIIGNRIAERLKELNMSQKELSETSGLPQSAISRYIKGSIIPKVGAIIKIAKALQVDPDFFMSEEKKNIKTLGTYQGVFKTELQKLVSQKCIEINHYISGCDSPFSYTQIREVQASLNDIEEVLGIKKKDNLHNHK
jgi:transcriptional regulator with XRE-family HTH domain